MVTIRSKTAKGSYHGSAKINDEDKEHKNSTPPLDNLVCDFVKEIMHTDRPDLYLHEKFYRKISKVFKASCNQLTWK